MTIEQGGTPDVPQIQWPSVVTDENRAAIQRHLAEDKSLSASVALAIVEEVASLAEQEMNIFVNLPPEVAAQPRILFGHHFRDWSSYKRTAHAVLNAESILQTGKPYEKPGTDFEAIEREDRGSFRDFLLDEEEQKELKEQRKKAGEIAWFNRELAFADLYKTIDSPLDFVDEVIRQETDRLHQRDKDAMEAIEDMTGALEQLEREREEIDIDSQDTSKNEETMEFIEGVGAYETSIKVEAMDCGRLRFHQLYQEFNH